MIKNILAVVVAAACAGAILEIIPEAAPAVAAGVSAAAQSYGTSVSDHVKPAVLDAARIAERRKADCTQAWPYYEAACLRDGRQSDGEVRVVRVIIADRSVTSPTQQTGR